MAQKTFVVAPNFSMAPPPRLRRQDGTPPPTPSPNDVEPFSKLVELQLGDIVLQPFGAQMKAVNRADRKPIDHDDLEKLARTGGFRETRKNLYNGRLGVWASLFAALGFGPEINISIHWEKLSNEVLELKNLETHRFNVTEEYAENVLASESVKAHWSKFKTAPMYIVSGIKVAKGAKQNSTDKTKLGADADAGDSSGQVKMGLLKFLYQRSTQTSFKTSTDFILAVQFTHIHVKVVDGKATAKIGEVSTKHGSMAGTDKEAEEVSLEYGGTDDSLEDAKIRFFEDFEEIKDEDGHDILIPTI
ncbi:hypothetical protein ACHAPJ_008165 [Fusarium lateritium]